MRSLVMNENEWAKEHIENSDIGDKPFETLCRVARYYLDNGCSTKETNKKLENFILLCEPGASIPKWSDRIDSALKSATKHSAIDIECISISRPEMEIIDELKSRQIRRLAFTLLCLAKYWDLIKPCNDHWVYCKDNEIMRMANINTSIKRQSAMYHTLNELGLIGFSKMVDNTNVRVKFITNGNECLQVSDLRNLGYQYLMCHGEPYYVCQNCGLTVKDKWRETGRKPKYCPGCATEIHMQQIINSVMRNRPVSKHLELDEREYTVYMHMFPNGKSYVGMTSQPLSLRWRNGSGYKFGSVRDAIQEFGWENVKHYILFRGLDRDTALFVESYYIKTRHTYLPDYGYNVNYKSYSHATGEMIPEYTKIEVDGDGNEIHKVQ